MLAVHLFAMKQIQRLDLLPWSLDLYQVYFEVNLIHRFHRQFLPPDCNFFPKKQTKCYVV